MSRPLAVKGASASAKLVLNTRLLSRPPRWGGGGGKDLLRNAARGLLRTGAGPGKGGIAVKNGRPASASARLEPGGCAAPAMPPGGQASSDVDVLVELYRRETPRMVRSVAKRRNSGDAEDLVHDAFVRLIRLPEGCASLDVPRTFLRRIATNLLRDRHRSDVRHQRTMHVVADDHTLPAFDPHGQLESRDMLRRVEAAMALLPDGIREVFVAHRVEGLSYSEIAERTGLSVKRVEKHMAKALVRIDRLLARS